MQISSSSARRRQRKRHHPTTDLVNFIQVLFKKVVLAV
jgi:hypothetical protein